MKAVIRYDWQRCKFRVDIGKRGNGFVGRYDSKKEAQIAADAAEHAYRLAARKQ